MKEEFKDLGLSKKVLKAIEKLGYTSPSKIQMKIIPYILSGNDVIGKAQTGTGKTLAYAASILSKINVNTRVVKAIILTPTRELAMQVSDEMLKLNSSSNFDILAVFGGSSIERQIKELKKGVDIVVGTPGRVLDLMKREVLNIDNLEFFVLDEADEMLDMGFLGDIESIFEKTNKDKQVLLLSATMPKEIKKLALNYMKEDYIFVEVEEKSKTAVTINQSYYMVDEKKRFDALCRLLDYYDDKKVIIFCQTKKECDELLMLLATKSYRAEAMHGDISQDMRTKTLKRFKMGAFSILIATDVAARGIHVDDIGLVINYKLPQDFESYVHRIGRTGRASKTGDALSLVGVRKKKFINDLEKFAKCKIEEKSIPTKDEILNRKYNNIMEQIKFSLDSKDYLASSSYLKNFNKEELFKISSALLKMAVDNSINADLEKDLVVKENNNKKKANNNRIFITLGKKDGITKKKLLDFVSKNTNLKKDSIKNIEVLENFSFMNIESGVNKVISKLNKKRYNNKRVSVEIANRKK